MLDISFEQRAVNTAFDKIVESTHCTLDNPAVVARLGGIVPEIQQLTASAFVPHLRNGRFVIPEGERTSTNVAIIPLTDEQADNAYELTAPMLDEHHVRAWDGEHVVSSDRYGLELPDEFYDFFRCAPVSNTSNSAIKGLRSNALARTVTSIGTLPDGRYWASRPRMIIRSGLLNTGMLACGATVAHEAIHASDIIEDGPLYVAPTYSAASELRAYHVGANIYQAGNITTPVARDSILIDTIREREVGDSDRPFAPTPTLMQLLFELDKI